MNPKTKTSLASLDNWVGKLIAEGKARSWTKAAYLDAMDMTSFKRFYNEMIPFVQILKTEIPTACELADIFINNEMALIENSKYPNTLGRIFYDMNLPFFYDDRIDKLLNTLGDIKNNVSNLLYQVNINE